ncbi:SAM domain (Sterile alpha motif) domain-containing protein [Phthorimaea operculella]|nr:SAM domain (Sterile alpha motif) domain-containing protein [Phthorimaea operculella]
MALVRRILGDAQAKLRKMVDEQVSVGSRVEDNVEPEPADPLITPATAAFSIDRAPGLLMGTLDKRNTSLNGDGTSTISRTRLSMRNGKDNPFIDSIQDDDNKENHANGKLESPVKWSTQNGSDSGTYAEIGTGANSNTSERNILDPADSSEEEVPLPDATSPGRSSDGPEPRADITASLDGAASPGGRSDKSRPDEVPASPGMLSAAQLARRLRVENERLQAELTRVRRLLVAAAERGEAGNALIEKAKGESGTEAAPLDPQQLEKELLLAREAVNSLKADKKRLKAEKFDLLNQMKQLYATLEDKEKELRDFIRNYEQMRSRGGASSALGAERAERERERAALLRHARDEAERSLQLAAALSARDTQLRHAREQLFEARRQLQAAGCLSEGESVASLGIGPPMLLGGPSGLIGDRGSCSADSGVRVTGSSDGGATSVCGGNLSDSTAEGGPPTLDAYDTDAVSLVSHTTSTNVNSTAEGGPPTLDAYDTDAVSLVSSAHHIYQLSTPRDCSPTLSPHNSGSPFTRSIDAGSLSRSVEQLSSPGECEASLVGGLRTRAGGKGGRGRGSAWGSISRVFARSRHRTKSGSATSGHESEPVYAGTGSTRAWSPLGSEAALREAASLPLARWRAPAIIAWLELALGMPQYAAAVADNVKSGKVSTRFDEQKNRSDLLVVSLPLARWRAPAIIAWLELALGMPQYAAAVADNVKSGKVSIGYLEKKNRSDLLVVSLPLAKWRAPAIIAWLELALGMPQYAAAVADNVKSGKVSIGFAEQKNRSDLLVVSLPLVRWCAPAIIAWLELALGMPQYAAAVADNVKSGKVSIDYLEKKNRSNLLVVSLPLVRWCAPAIIAWLELALGMPQYANAVADNVKSGKIRALNGQVLLELTDADLEVGLGITQPMHRKKLRLAIEERRRPDLVRNPAIGQLTHAWVAAEWLPDLGLAQYAESFLASLVDARMLDTISKKELEKYLGVTRKFHQASIVHGIHLLRIMKYDRQALAVRRHQCENVDADPLVWTNQRFMRWAHNIDLGEFAENLKDSGVHGGLVVLEPSFTGETMATALGIPPSKSIIRRHLVAEFDALIIPARYTIFCQVEELQVEAARASMLSTKQR